MAKTPIQGGRFGRTGVANSAKCAFEVVEAQVFSDFPPIAEEELPLVSVEKVDG